MSEEFAFPFRTPEDRDGCYTQYYGMTLRDYFAAAALQGIVAANDCPSSNEGVASWAYIMADAMLAERNKKND